MAGIITGSRRLVVVVATAAAASAAVVVVVVVIIVVVVVLNFLVEILKLHQMAQQIITLKYVIRHKARKN